MTTYAVGDIQGCLAPLQELLAKVHFTPDNDQLWIAGDLVNRGPQSLETLRYIKALGDAARIVLGNHDLHLLACAAGVRKTSKKDTFDEILRADDSKALLHWLRQQPLIYRDKNLGYTMVHAGIPPVWSLPKALALAEEVHAALQNESHDCFFANMYGNQPDQWHDDIKGLERLRLITNYFTRMRFCDSNGRLELKTKTGVDAPPKGFAPWFDHPNPAYGHEKILFGHWAALMGVTQAPQFIGLDTGCVWGGQLSLLRLEDGHMFRVNCR